MVVTSAWGMTTDLFTPRKKYKTANTTIPALVILSGSEGRMKIKAMQIGINRTLYGCEKTAKAINPNCADLAHLELGSGDKIINSAIVKIFQIEKVTLVTRAWLPRGNKATIRHTRILDLSSGMINLKRLRENIDRATTANPREMETIRYGTTCIGNSEVVMNPIKFGMRDIYPS